MYLVQCSGVLHSIVMKFVTVSVSANTQLSIEFYFLIDMLNRMF